MNTEVRYIITIDTRHLVPRRCTLHVSWLLINNNKVTSQQANTPENSGPLGSSTRLVLLSGFRVSNNIAYYSEFPKEKRPIAATLRAAPRAGSVKVHQPWPPDLVLGVCSKLYIYLIHFRWLSADYFRFEMAVDLYVFRINYIWQS